KRASAHFLYYNRDPPDAKAVDLRVAPPAPRRRRRRDVSATLCLRRSGSGSVTIYAVVTPSRLQTGGQRQRLASLGVAAEDLQRAPHAEEREVVGRRPVDHGLELLRGLLIAPGVKQRAAQSLADRALVRCQIARARQRDGGLVVMSGLEQLGAAAEELIDVFHPGQFNRRHRILVKAGGARRDPGQAGGARRAMARAAAATPTAPAAAGPCPVRNAAERAARAAGRRWAARCGRRTWPGEWRGHTAPPKAKSEAAAPARPAWPRLKPGVRCAPARVLARSRAAQPSALDASASRRTRPRRPAARRRGRSTAD